MLKLAEVKTAEVAGFLGTLVDLDLIKVANEEDFATIVHAVSDALGDGDYSMEDALSKTAEVMDEVYGIYKEAGLLEDAGEELEKEAEEVELTEDMIKEALYADFVEGLEKEAGMKESIMNLLGKGKAKAQGAGNYVGGKAKGAAGYVTGKAKAGYAAAKGAAKAGFVDAPKDAADIARLMKVDPSYRTKDNFKALAKAMGKATAAYGGAGATATGAGYLAYKKAKS